LGRLDDCRKVFGLAPRRVSRFALTMEGLDTVAVTLGVVHLLAIATIGFDNVWDYYLQIGPMLVAYYRAHDSNLSAWTIGQRLFIRGGGNFYAPPLLDLPCWQRYLFLYCPCWYC
jgi:hypothetical protein